jgi:hypothetical protein
MDWLYLIGIAASLPLVRSVRYAVAVAVDLEPLEAAVLDKLLAGDHPVLAALRGQLAVAAVTQRELTGVGFFTDFSVPQTADPAPVRRLRFGDVHANISGVEHGAGFLLFVDDGVLTTLEGFTYDEPWPEEIKEFSVRYVDPTRPDVASLPSESQR